MSETTVVHLLRHGEVENPDQIIYGRLPGYHLSANGQSMARAAEDFFVGRNVGALFSSPLERALETARPVAERLGLSVVIDERLIEPWNHFEGLRFGVGDGSLLRPAHWPHLINPFLPSWGEPYRQIVARMLAVMTAAQVAAGGAEAVCVSHQLPIWVTRRHVERRPLWHNPMARQCALGSVTSFSYAGDRIVGVSYAVPARRQVPQGDAAQ
jgi:broad specificity phosphatase PhoE